MKITYTRQQFIDYITPILTSAYQGIREGDEPENVEAVKMAQEIIRLTLLEARELDPQQTNLKAQLFDAVTVLKNILELARTDKHLLWALAGEPWNLIMTFLNRINATVVAAPFECAEAAANPAHRCLNQCYVCRFPAERNPQPKAVQDGKG